MSSQPGPYENPSSGQTGREGPATCRGEAEAPSPPVLFRFRLWSSCLPRCYKSSSHLLLLIHSPFSSPTPTQNLATMQEHSSSCESPPRCGQVEHRLEVNTEAGTLCLQAPILLFFETMGLAAPLVAEYKKTPPLVSPGVRMNCSLGSALPHCG